VKKREIYLSFISRFSFPLAAILFKRFRAALAGRCAAARAYIYCGDFSFCINTGEC
jgi:hypothetical protein